MLTDIKNGPVSHFFTEENKIISGFQDAKYAFGPVPDFLDKKFRLTNTFSHVENLKAFAVTDGTLFIVPQKGSTDLVNIFLKPDSNGSGLGIKVKYYVYRSVLKKNLYKENNSFLQIVKKNDPQIIDFLIKIWNEYLEYNEINDSSTVVLDAGKLGISQTELATYKAFYKSNKYILPKVTIGTYIGNFANEFGFEVVLDEGDFSQDKSDTGFEFANDFFSAKECVLSVIGGNDPNVYYGNLPSVSEKVFRESIYLFLDPIAYYGAHITSVDKTENKTKNKGKIISKVKEYTDPDEIYTNINLKFKNNDLTYLYIKSKRGRSYNFYPNTSNPITNPIEGLDANKTFAQNQWPIRIIKEKNLSFKLNIFSNRSTMYCYQGSEKKLYKSNDLMTGTLTTDPKFQPLTFVLPIINTTKKISSFIYLSYNDGIEDSLNGIFGPVNISSIIESGDGLNKQGSTVSHLRPNVIKSGEDCGLYNMKVVLEGYLANVDPPTTPVNPDSVNRTYILFPQEVSKSSADFNKGNLNASYYTGVNDSKSYCHTIYGEGEIWKGKIYDGEDFNALSYRRKDNDNNNFPLYQLGISQADYINLTQNINNATNLVFNFKNKTFDPNGSFVKYDLNILFDAQSGVSQETNEKVAIYTVDGYFFFTKKYSNNFEYFNEFANIAVDFLPVDMDTTLNGYESAGFDYIGFNTTNKVYTNRSLYKELLGKYYNTTTGKLENYDVDNPGNYTFKTDREFFHKLLYEKYNCKPTNWRKNTGDFPFHTDSFITLYPGSETTIKLKFTKNNEVTKLFIKYNKKYISVNNPTATASINDEFELFEIPSSNYQPSINESYTINVKSLQVTEIDQALEVYAVENNKTSLAGKCWLRSNSERYKLKVVLVNCKTNISSVKEGLPSGERDLTKKIVKNFLHQLLIEPDFVVADLDLDIAEFKPGGIHFNAPTYGIKSTPEMFKFCKDKLPATLRDECTLLFFREYGGSMGLAGEAYKLGGADGARIFLPGLKKNTIAHELLHSIGLEHSFDNNSEFTFEIYSTDNVMDYNGSDPDSKRKLIWKWQDKKIKDTNNNNKLIPI
ncbi:hypothetical protein [Chryseobacterium sp.]|uniref:hypothetical protein n=1 Tax=Chryseobacterium sp. TaxID=1871047 RepID=UPI0025B80FA5|nr:hypothetical protein [Chryseobacterium sp.]MBV8325214.1 hypothetical protein [Chryseobacterium sp.]